MDMYFRTLADKSGRLQYLIQIRDSYIHGIETLEEAISIAEEMIEENILFIESSPKLNHYPVHKSPT
jgi:hypothetical protein